MVLRSINASFTCAAFALSISLILSSSTFAQWGYTPPAPQPPEPVQLEDYVTTNVQTTLSAYGEGLLGDTINPDTGSLSFQSVDVSIPGNSSLPVMFGRYIDANAERHVNLGPNMPVSSNGNQWEQGWSVMVPHIMTRTPYDGVWRSDRCTDPIDEPDLDVSGYHGQSAPATWSGRYGIRFYSPGSGLRPFLNGDSPAFAANPPDYVTRDYWRIDCRSGANGEYFEATSPEGHTYVLDKFYTYKSGQTYQPRFPGSADWDSGLYDASENHIAYPTEIRDRFGNWVRFEYNDAAQGVSRIYSNDGREILINYTNGSVSSVEANGRTWTYSYTNGVLDRVTLPDGRYWTIGNLDGVGRVLSWIFGQSCYFGTDAYIRHPDGVEGFFTTQKIVNFRSAFISGIASARARCMSRQGNYSGNMLYNTGFVRQDSWNNFFTSAVTEKRLVIPGAPDAVWTYDYEDGDHYNTNVWGTSVGDNPTDTTLTRKVRTITNPEGHVTRLEFDIRLDTEGTLLRREMFANASSSIPMQTEVFTHNISSEPVGSPVQFNYGMSINAHIYHNQRTRSELMRDGETYTTNMVYDGFNRVTSSSASSSLGSGTRNSATVYQYDITDWALGLPTRVTRNGRVFEEFTYTANHQLHTVSHFGTLAATIGYNAQGQVNSITDALNRVTLLSNHYRGHARNVTLPDGAQLSWAINGNGWITSMTDARGQTTGYSYNAMGWPTLINRPAGLADTSISYSNLGAGTRQTVTEGSVRTITDHDGMHRPLLVNNQALSNGGGSIYTRYEYDGLSQQIFASIPSTSSHPTSGVTTSYDGLGRVTQVAENMAPYATTTTAYLSGNRTQFTDPLGNVTINTASGFGGPGDGAVTLIQHPMGLSTAMTYDIWGNLLTARQYGSHNGYTSNHTQSWVYDSRMRLCRHSVPETGDTLYAYDNANQVTAIARGQSAGSSCASSLPGSATITQVWDNRGRLDQVLYPDSAPDMNFGYDANGNMTSAVRGTTSWSYAYNNANAITSETLSVDGLSFTTSYTRNANGYVTNQVLPGGRTINYNPDGFGRAKRIRSSGFDYASAGSYHVSGALQSYNMGNGRNYSATFNSRHQMTSQTVGGSSTLVDFDYLYNAGGQIIDIDDNVVSGQDRVFTYDGLGRLATASGPWGSGSFTYDPLGNLRRQVLGSRTVDISYNALNRVSQVRDSARGSLWDFYSYDSRGNVTSNDQLNWAYDRSEQPISMSGNNSGSFVYDAHRRRVKQVIDGETIYSVYSQSGSLIYRRNHTTGEETDYLRLGVGGRSVARVVDNGSTETVTYTHTDHLGSPVASTSASGALLWREDYTPFGEARQRPAANDNDEGYTGHISDSDTGIVYMQARYYDPAIGRFLSSDPVGFASGGPAYFNRYAYVGNNPLNATDPTGEFAQFLIGCAMNTACRTTVASVGGAILGGGANLAVQLASGEDVSWREVGVSALGGAATGAALANGKPPSAVGGIVNTATSLTNSALDGDFESLDSGIAATLEAGTAGLLGAALGPAGGRGGDDVGGAAFTATLNATEDLATAFLTGTVAKETTGIIAGETIATMGSPAFEEVGDVITQGLCDTMYASCDP
ncbi:RHS repeat-associated core domain-containing protein [Maricaulis sp. MIT060901]|uniref:RHS repeat domain-containing protein n=1 Tax=Maricaulis sp. MIT060901 TaxID=3096993 RepID=UPI00399B3D81